MTELKPCPFCGDTHVDGNWRWGDSYNSTLFYSIECGGCFMEFITQIAYKDEDISLHHADFEECHIKWNKRAGEDKCKS